MIDYFTSRTFFVQNSSFQQKSQQFTVPIINLASHEINLVEGRQLGGLTPVEEIYEVRKKIPQKTSNGGRSLVTPMSAEQIAMININPELTPEQQDELRSLVSSYSDCFSYSDLDLQTAKGVTNWIILKENQSPSKQWMKTQCT